MIEEYQAPSFYLDSLPTELVDNVLRFFSRIPCAKNWSSFIDVRDLPELFAIRGELGVFLESRFDTLCVSKVKDCFEEYWSVGWKLQTEPHLWTDNIDTAFAFVKVGGGKSLRTLVIGDGICERECDGETFVDEFLKHCPNVTSLSISESGGCFWADKFGSQLEKLEVRSRITPELPMDCISLRELNMSALFDNIRPKDLWQRIGFSLEKLVISGYFPDDYDVDNMKKYCPNLKDISLEGTDIGIADLLASYGDQLEYALLYLLDEDDIGEVAEACPNARFHLSSDAEMGEMLSVSSVKILGPRLEAVTLCNFLPKGDLVEWTNAWNKCTNLREIYIEPGKVEDVEAIFSTPKEQVKELRLWFWGWPQQADVERLISLYANGTKCVEILKCDGDSLCLDNFTVLAEKNRASLKIISIGKKYFEENEKLNEVLRSFLKLPALEELYLDYKIPEDIVRKLSNRGVYWHPRMY